MSSVKISQLPVSSNVNANPALSIFPTTDTGTGQTTQLSAEALGNSLYSNNTLIVGTGGAQLPNTVAQFTGISGGYTQVNEQNLNTGGTADYIVTADIGNDTNYYIDMGITNSNYSNVSPFNSLGTSIEPLSGYLYVQGNATYANSGNLVIGTVNPGAETRILSGGVGMDNVIVKIKPGEVKIRANVVLNVANVVLVNTVTFYDGTKQTTAGPSNAYTMAAFAQANSAAANTIYQTGVNTTQNTQIQLAWNEANTSLQNTASIIIPGNVTFNGANSFFNGNIVTTGTMTTTGNVVTTGLLNATGNTVFTGPFTVYGNTLNYGPTTNYGNLTTTGTVTTTGNLIANGPTVFNGNFINNGTTVNNGQTTLNGNTTTTGSFIMTNSTFASNSYAIAIIGSSSGQTQAPIADGTMLQITGKDGVNSKLIVDAAGTGVYSLFNGRSMRGLANTPSALLSGDILVKFGGNGYGATGFGSGVNSGGAYMQYVAAENYTDTQKGTNILFGTTPVGSNTVANVLTLTGTTAIFANNVSIANNSIANTKIANTYVYGSATANSGVTQITSRTTGVTANGITGTIIGYSASAFQHGTGYVFTVNNSSVLHTTDIVFVSVQNSNCPVPQVSVANTRVGSFDICVFNGSGAGNDAAYTMNVNFGIIRVGS